MNHSRFKVLHVGMLFILTTALFFQPAKRVEALDEISPTMVYNVSTGAVGVKLAEQMVGKILKYKIDWANPALATSWVDASTVSLFPQLFPDVDPSNPFFYWISLLRLAQIVSGYSDGTYSYSTAVDRSQLAVVIANSLKLAGVIPDYDHDGKPLGSDDQNGNKVDDDIENCAIQNGKTFTDVPVSNKFYSYISCIGGLGIVKGYSDGTYHPSEIATRGQIAVYIANSLVKTGLIDSVDGCAAQSTANFPDVPTSYGFYKYIKCIAGLGIVSGYSDGTYRPDESVLRDQMAKFIANSNNSLLAQALVYPVAKGPIFRAQLWVNASVNYSQTTTAYLNGADATKTTGYRKDCSGFVSMAWGLPATGLNVPTTVTLPHYATMLSSKDDLMAGDTINNRKPGNKGHVVIFVRWIDKASGRFIAYEENGGQHKAVQTALTLVLNGNGWSIMQYSASGTRDPWYLERKK